MKQVIMPLLLLSLLYFSGCNVIDKDLNSPKNKQKDTNEILSKNVKVISSEKEFNKLVLNSSRPAIVKFETEWCSICKEMVPIYNQLADRFKGKINFYKVDIDKLRSLTPKYEITGVPTLILFKKGKVAEKLEGLIEKEELLEKIKEKFSIE